MVLKKNRGITLVALVITIIILLVLAGISISALTNIGLFAKAKEAKEKTQNAAIEQNIKLDEYENEMNKYAPKQNENILAKKVKVGDYVNYIPDTVSNTDSKYKTLISNLTTYSGTDKNTTETLKQEKDGENKLRWRVLDIDKTTGQVRLISEKTTTSTISLYGYNGYNNAVKLLDDTCSTLYNSTLASNVQNIKIEDIQDKMKTDYTTISSDYGNRFTPSNKYYPNILLKEKEQKVTVEGANTIGTEIDLSEQKGLLNQNDELQADILDIKYTYWNKKISVDDFEENNKEMYYKLFLNNQGKDDKENYYNTYWMASRCISASTDHANFNIYRVNSGYVNAEVLYNSSGVERPNTFAFRPVITLNSNVQIDMENSGDGSSAEHAYEIK